MTVAQITDLHVRGRGIPLPHIPHVAKPLRRALSAIHALRERPSCILATGDLTESGSTGDYHRLRELLSDSEIPVFLMPGNHDDRHALRSAFPGHTYLHGAGEPVLYTIEGALLRVIALDSSEPSHRGGFLNTERLAWLDERLRERPDTPTILAMHHPPFATRIGAFDSQPFAGRERLAEIVQAHRQVRRVIAGHIHQMLSAPWCGTIAVTAPSTAPTLALHSRGIFKWEPGGFLLHRYDRQDGVATQLVGTSAEPVAIGA